MLRRAVEENVSLIEGRLPLELRPRARLLRFWLKRTSAVAAPVFVLVVALVGAANVGRLKGSVTSAALAVAAAATPAEETTTVTTDPSVVSQQVDPALLKLGVRRIVVDAGHGGENLGTISAEGLAEKELTLDIGERVRQLVVKAGFDAVMTRTSDETLSLRERASTANAQHGDIFLSIHLNSLQPRSARGIETYYLGPSGGPEPDAIAATENQHAGYSLSDMRTLLERIYVDAKRDESKRLAMSVQRALVRTLRSTEPALIDRGVKMAPFVVLIATEMPAILAEVSCLSNAADAQRLKTAEYRQTIAAALVSGIQTFVSETATNVPERMQRHGS